jgi:predicted Fe-Mo cluster-binding NifX family protein
MRIAFSVDQDQGLESIVSPHFGRCPYYVLADVEERTVKRVTSTANPFFENHQPGQVPAFIKGQGADVIITGGMGRRAIASFEHSGVEPVTGAFGSVAHALQEYLAGRLGGAQPCRESVAHLHRHRGQPPGHEAYEKDEVGRLREEAEALGHEILEVQARIDRLKPGR